MRDLARGVKQFALDQAMQSAGDSWSDIDNEIFNAYWDENKLDEKVPEVMKDLESQVKIAKEGAEKLQKSGGRFSVDANGDLLFDGQWVEPGDRRLYGGIGRNVTDISTAAEGAYSGTSYDPRFYETYTYSAGDAGEQTGYRLRPEVSERLGDRVQVNSLSYGGAGEIIDPSLLTYDEEFGVLTPRSNIREPQTSGIGGFLEQYLPYMLAAGMGAAIAATGGFAGLGIAGAGEAGGVAAGEGLAAAGEAAALPGASSGFPAGAGIAGPSLETAGISTGALSGTTTAAGGATTGLLNTVTIPEAITIPASTITTPTLASLPNVGGSMLGAVGDWFNNLSPMGQRAITSALGTGAQAILADRRQESQQDFTRQQQETEAQRRREEEERSRQFTREQQDLAYQRRREEEERAAEERRIRGTPQAMQFTVTPRPGLIGSRIGG